MELKYFLLIILLIIFPIVWYRGTYAKAGIGEKPIIFSSAIFELIANLATILFFAGSLYLLFISWETLLLLALIIVLAGFLFGKLRKIK